MRAAPLETEWAGGDLAALCFSATSTAGCCKTEQEAKAKALTNCHSHTEVRSGAKHGLIRGLGLGFEFGIEQSCAAVFGKLCNDLAHLELPALAADLGEEDLSPRLEPEV